MLGNGSQQKRASDNQSLQKNTPFDSQEQRWLAGGATDIISIMELRRLSILGVGLLGGSLGLAVRRIASEVRIVGYGHRAGSLERAIVLGAIDETTTDARLAVAGADLVVLCTPVGTFDSLLGQIAGALKTGAIVTDVGSTKRAVVELAETRLPAGVHFVGSHPMAGSEKRGVEFSRADLFENATCLLTPTARTNAGALQEIEKFWQRLGMRTLSLSPERHDRQLAAISHLPHALAAALVRMQDESSFELAGKGFWDTTRIASGDAGLWRDIFMDNRENVLEGIDSLKAELEGLAGCLKRADAAGVQAWLEQAARQRDSHHPGSNEVGRPE